MNTALEKSISNVGSVTALAAHLGISVAAVSKWKSCPRDRVLAVAHATGWKVTPHELRPDFYPHANDGLPEPVRSSVRVEQKDTICTEPAEPNPAHQAAA